MSPRRDNHGVENEPWMTGEAQSTEHVGHEPAHHSEHLFNGEEDAADHTVWDEPVWTAGGAPPPDGAFTYAAWYRRNLDRFGEMDTWFVSVTLACIGGMGAFLGIFWSTYTGDAPAYAMWFAVGLFGPLMEEMLKIGAALMVLERRPFFFRRPAQFFVATIGSALLFATIENVLYIYFYFPQGSDAFIFWRWTVCTGLHVAATAIATLGLVRIWQAAQPSENPPRDFSRPSISNGAGFFTAAIVLHGAYNTIALFAGFAGMSF